MPFCLILFYSIFIFLIILLILFFVVFIISTQTSISFVLICLPPKRPSLADFFFVMFSIFFLIRYGTRLALIRPAKVGVFVKAKILDTFYTLALVALSFVCVFFKWLEHLLQI